jgi:hypothetical protein
MGPQYDPKSGIKLGVPGTIPKWGGNSKVNSCFYCGGRDHFVGPECEEMNGDIQAGLIKMNAEGKLRLSDGSYIPNVPNTATIKERVEKYYARKLNQFYCGNDEDDNVPMPNLKTPAQLATTIEEPSRRRARLEYELDLKEREEALELKQLKLEREEKKKQDQAGKMTRASHALEVLEQLTEEDIVTIKSKSGFP